MMGRQNGLQRRVEPWTEHVAGRWVLAGWRWRLMDTDAVVASGRCRNPGGRAVARLCAAAAWRGYVDALEAGDARGAAQRARKAGDAEAERLRATSGCGPRRVRGQTGTVDEPAKREEDTDE